MSLRGVSRFGCNNGSFANLTSGHFPFFIRLRQNTLQFTAGMNGVVNRAVAR